MTPIEWTPKMLTHPAFDDEHRALVDMINQMEALYDGKKPSAEESVSAITKLLERMNSHTKNEEALMHKTAYTRLIPHKIEHDHFTAKLSDFCDDIKNGNATLCEESTLFIRTWLYDHIVSVDKLFAKWLNEKGLLQQTA